MQREKEVAKMKKAQAMREVLEAAERLAKEEKKNRRRREEPDRNIDGRNLTTDATSSDSNTTVAKENDKYEQDYLQMQRRSADLITNYPEEKPSPKDVKEVHNHRDSENDKQSRPSHADKSEEAALDLRSLQVPVSKDVAIVLSGRLEDPEILSRANLQLVNLVMTPSPRRLDYTANAGLSLGLNALMKNNIMERSPRNLRRSARDASSIVVENRLLTPSKYRIPAGRDFGTQTDVESDIQELREKLQESSIREHGTMKDKKDTTNANRRNVEK